MKPVEGNYFFKPPIT